jgi:hypothetical protein
MEHGHGVEAIWVGDGSMGLEERVLDVIEVSTTLYISARRLMNRLSILGLEYRVPHQHFQYLLRFSISCNVSLNHYYRINGIRSVWGPRIGMRLLPV